MRYSKGRKGVVTDPQPELGPTLLWEGPDKAISIHVRPRVVATLECEISLNWNSGQEIGGILLGQVLAQERRTIVIEDFEPVMGDHAEGPFRLNSEADRQLLEKAVAGCAQLSVVGFYRSHLREGLFLSEDDLSLINSCFKDPNQVFLVLKPVPDGTTVAGFFFWEDGQLRSESSYREIPFVWTGGIPSSRVFDMSGQTAPVEEPSAQPANRDSARITIDMVPRARRAYGAWALAALLTLASCILGYRQFLGYQQSRTRTGTRTLSSLAANLGLKVDRQGNDLLLRWDRNSPAVLNGQSATLSIVDGKYRKEMELEANQLRNGQILYPPDTDDVLLQLEIVAADRGRVNESIRVLGGPHESTSPLVQAASSETKSVTDVKRLERFKPHRVGTTKEFRREDLKGGAISRRIADLLEPPSIAGESQSSPPIDTPVLPKEISWAEPPGNAKEKPAIPAAPQLPAGEVVKPVQLPQTSAQANSPTYIGPHPIREVSPVIPQTMRTFLTHDTQVVLTVSVDATGKVDQVKVVSADAKYLAQISVNAARLWRYQPAQLNGKPVPGDTKIAFHFRASGGAWTTSTK